MTIGVLGVYVATIGRTHTLKVVLSRVCIFGDPLYFACSQKVCSAIFIVNMRNI